MTLLGNFSVGLAKFNAFLISFYPEHTIFSDKFELIFCQRVCFLKFFFCFAEVLTNSHVHIGPLALLRLSSLNLRSLLRRSVGDRVLIKFVNCRRKLSQLWVMWSTTELKELICIPFHPVGKDFVFCFLLHSRCGYQTSTFPDRHLKQSKGECLK